MSFYQPKALVLFSGGLDSQIAAALVRSQGVYVKLLHFYTGFCITEHKRKVGLRTKKGEIPSNPALKAAAHLKLPIEIVDISQDYFDIVINPKHGYGKNVNPCIDCRIMMLKKAKDIMEKENFDFVVTGEVLGQRPMTQNLRTLKLIEKECSLERLIVRPLSQKLLPITLPEEKKYIDREKLLGISGRSRKVQEKLSKELNLLYNQPAGGCCYLTDENYAFRFKEERERTGFITKEDLILFSVGRHFRLFSGAKVIVARNEGEVNFLKTIKNNYDWAYRKDNKGTFAICKNCSSLEDINIMASLVARYSKNELCEVEYSFKNEINTIEAKPISDILLDKIKIIRGEKSYA